MPRKLDKSIIETKFDKESTRLKLHTFSRIFFKRASEFLFDNFIKQKSALFSKTFKTKFDLSII
ncbi:hypothetical protein Syun_017350 [Stephania yunnanensis]|uniref:Uncharacterized protein n=1 Tax=Stephania yunnanensis TaxID=152371 RepID=A0AAP0J910_9MAGN